MADQMDYIEELMIARLTGNIEQKESDFLDEMIEADADVARLWQEHLLVYSQLKDPYDKEAAWQAVQAGIKMAETKNGTRKKRALLPMLTFAAVFVFMLTGLVYYFNNAKKVTPVTPIAAVNRTAANSIRFTSSGGSVAIDRNQDTAHAADADIVNKNGALVFAPKNNATGLATIEVPQGLDKKIQLSDGSYVWVNAATRLSFPLVFTGHTREVTLDGEAYFEIAHDQNKPFIVHTNQVNVQVLGTHFNIRAYSGEMTQASLIQGSIAAGYGTQKIILKAGKAVRLENNQLTEGDFDQTTVLAWMKGAYVLEEEPLSTVSHTVDRWFGYKFAYADTTIAKIKFTGALEKTQTIEAFLGRVAAVGNLSYTIEGSTVTLKRK